MVAPIPRYEVGDTKEFSITYSSAPGTRPYFTVFQGSGAGTVITSTSATSSSSMAWFAYFTLVDCESFYTYQWVASYSAGAAVNRGTFKIVRTDPG